LFKTYLLVGLKAVGWSLGWLSELAFGASEAWLPLEHFNPLKTSLAGLLEVCHFR